MNTQKLTDFILGELTDTERLEVEAAIERDPALQTEVEEIRRVVAEIQAVMRDENFSENTVTAKTASRSRRIFSLRAIGSVIAAMLILGVSLAVFAPQVLVSISPHEARRINVEICDDVLDAESLHKPAEFNLDRDDDLSRTESESKPSQKSSEISVSENKEVTEAWKKLSEDQVKSNKWNESGDIVTDKRDSLKQEESNEKDSQFGAISGNIVISSPTSPPPAAAAPTVYTMSPVGGQEVPLSGGKLPMVGGGRRSAGEQLAGMSAEEVLITLAPQGREENTFMMGATRGGNSLGKDGIGTLVIRDEKQERSDISKAKKDQEKFTDQYNNSQDEAYHKFIENEFLQPSAAPFSTFSVDVDTAAYSTMRRFVKEGGRPPKDAVRLEEYINYFKYSYPQPAGDVPFAVVADVARCPWESQHLLARVALQGKIIENDARPAINLVFLIDVSGSMEASNRLPLVKRSLTELVERLQSRDRVAIVTYAGSTQVVLPSVSGNEKRAILDSITALGAGGSTAGASGIKLAYETAKKYYTKEGQNRVILCTDGDFNVGTTDNKTLEEMIGDEAKSGVFLTVLGFGMGNYKDERLSILAQRGNGNYGYIDSFDEAQKLLVEGLTGTLITIAKDVKIQIDFNPKRVAAYRLLGYENRKLRDEDFHNDAKDAGEIGAGHSVTALYEIVPIGVRVPQAVDASRYAEKPADAASGTASEPASETKKADSSAADASLSRELLLVKLRYKEPEASKSKLIETPLIFTAGENVGEANEATGDFGFAAGVALFGMLLRDSQYVGSGNFSTVRELVSPNTAGDKYRQEFIELVKQVMNK